MISLLSFLDRRSKVSAFHENKTPQIMACYIIPFILSEIEVNLLSSLWLRVKLMKVEFVFTQKSTFLISKGQRVHFPFLVVFKIYKKADKICNYILRNVCFSSRVV